MAVVLISLIFSACGPSLAEQAATVAAQTAAAATSTPIPSSTPTSTNTPNPTLTSSPSPTASHTPTPEPQVVLLRGAKGCDREHNIIANSPIPLHYGVWGSVGKAYAEGSWDILDITLTIDGDEVQGEKQPVAADLIRHCGFDAEDSYWIFYIANIDGIQPGRHYLEVTYYANGVIEDGFGNNNGPGTILTHSYFLNSATEN